MSFSNFSGLEMTGPAKKPKRPYSFPHLHLSWEDFAVFHKDLCGVCDWLLPCWNFRAQVTTNQTDGKDMCNATSSLWHSRPESLRIQMSARDARRVYIVFFIGKGTFVSLVFMKME